MMSSSRDPDGACARASEAGNAQARTRLMILQSMRHLLKNVAMSATEADAAPNCTSRRFTSAMAGTIDRNASIGVQRPTADIAAIEVIHETAGLFGVVECRHALPGQWHIRRLWCPTWRVRDRSTKESSVSKWCVRWARICSCARERAN